MEVREVTENLATVITIEKPDVVELDRKKFRPVLWDEWWFGGCCRRED